MILNLHHPAVADSNHNQGHNQGHNPAASQSMTPAAACIVRTQAAEIRDGLAVIEAEIGAMPPAVRGLVRSRLAKAQREISEARRIADRFARKPGTGEVVA